MNGSAAPNPKTPTVTIIVLVIAVLMMLAGFKNGEHRSYFQKAIMVCTQCIGLG